MDDWIKILVAFIHNDRAYNFQTKTLDEMVVATPSAAIEVQHDARWKDLTALGEIFAGQ
jgi:hypothetical protein